MECCTYNFLRGYDDLPHVRLLIYNGALGRPGRIRFNSACDNGTDIARGSQSHMGLVILD